MLPNEIMQSDVLDILFEHRNKTYGAYSLRKSYNKRLVLALAATLFVAAIFSVLQLLQRSANHMYVKTISMIDDPHLINLQPAEPKAQPHFSSSQSTIHYRQAITSTPVIASNDQPTTLQTIDELTRSMVGNEPADGEIPGGNIVPAPNNGEPVAITAAGPITDEKPLISAEIMPEFPGGIDALIKFLLKNIRQPDDLQAGEKIVVMASFVVSKNGSIEDVKIVNGGRPDLDKEVLRVIEKMPVWKPGQQNGHEVPVYFNLPITFLGADGE